MFVPLKIELRRSRFWWAFVVVIHLCGLGSVALLAPLGYFVQLVLILTLLISFASFYRFPINQGINVILWNTDTQIFATQNSEGIQTVHTTPQTLLVFPFLVCIKLEARAPIANQWLILLPDMMSRDEWRRLMVLARWSELNA